MSRYPAPVPGDERPYPDRSLDDRSPGEASRPPATLREALQADPLGIAGRRPADPPDDGPPATPAQQRWALIRLVVVVAALIALGYAAGVGETLLLVLALIACIVAHEFGHYITAKAAGVKVTQFFVGFGPRLWSVRRGETEYGVRGIPLGGYCRIVGMNNLEEVDPADEARTYRQARLWRRLSIDVAGSAMHFLIAIVVLFAMFFWTGDSGWYLKPPPDTATLASSPIVEIDGLTAKGQPVASPAQQAGFKIGDRIEAVDGRHFASWAAVTGYIQSHAGQRLDVTVERDGRLVQLFPTPVNRNDYQIPGVGKAKSVATSGFLGIAIGGPTIHSSFTQSISRAGGAWVTVSSKTLGAFGRLVSFHGISSYVHMLGSQKAADSASSGSVRFRSPVGTVRLLHQASQDGLPTVLWLVAVINLSLGIFNLLPLFPLDGGRVVVALYEGIRSRRRRPYHADLAKLLPVFYLGLAVIVFLGASALFLDLRDLAA